jgi:hypothetical protein
MFNELLTLQEILSEILSHRLGNLGVLEWVIAKYQVSTEKS